MAKVAITPVFLPIIGLSQGLCYEQRNCQGSTIQAGSQSARQCCVGTNNGMSYSVGGVCTVRQCVGERVK